LSARRDFVEEYNCKRLAELGTELVNYEGFEVRRDGKVKKVANTMAVGAQAIITKNM
jgi:hypothetical protein